METTARSVISRNVLVLGAGAMGCYFAARLVEAGANVTLIDIDEARLDHLNRQGLTVVDQVGKRVVPVKASTAGQLSEAASLIIVFTKGAHTRSAIRHIAHLVGTGTVALTLQNGLGNPEAIAEIVPPDHVMFGVTDIPADLHPPAEVHSPGEGKITFWSMKGEDASALHETEALLKAAGLNASASSDARVAVWEKVAFNAALNALTAILECPVGGIDTPAGRQIIADVVDETIAVACTQGLEVERNRIMDRVDHALTTHREHKPSMLQDILAGRATEIDMINGGIMASGAAAGVPTPVNATLARLVQAKEAALRI